MPCDIAKTSSEIENVDWSTGTGSGQHYTNVRFGSGSSQASQSSGDICRICHCESDPKNPLLTPCYCAGSLKYVHQACLQQWLTASETNSCELCKFPFIMHTKIKPFNEWRSLDISGVERRRLCCSVLFHCAAALCVIWSLCVLIERAADDVKRGLIDWPFWTKLAVVTVGLTGGVVFMYIQCKAYLHLCHRWKARNRILLIQNAPEKVHPLSHPSPSAPHQQNRYAAVQEPRSIGFPISSNREAQAACSGAIVNQPIDGMCAGNSELDGAAAALHNVLASSPHHILQQVDMDMDTTSRASAAAGDGVGLPSPQQGQIVANIECSQSQHNYERDWALDDVVSQISSFRPCPQGSGSMTPFHDSIHNVLEHSQSSSRGSVNDVCSGSRQDLSTGGVSFSDTGREHAMQLSSLSGSGIHKEPSISSGVSAAVANGLGGFAYKPQSKRYSNSSIFLENRDILNDSVMLGIEPDVNVGTDGYPSKLNYRHSSVLTAPDISAADNLEKYLGKDLRRYSDTKLLASDSDLLDPMIFKTAVDTATPPACATTTPTADVAQQQRVKNHSAAAHTILDMKLPTSPLSSITALGTTSSSSNSHKQPNVLSSLCRSMHTVDLGEQALVAIGSGGGAVGSSSERDAKQPIDKGRLFFKSLPNLSSSCESLIKK